MGSYSNLNLVHPFFSSVPYDYKIVKSSPNIFYYSVSIKTVNNSTLKIIDQNGDFRGETVTLHRKKVYEDWSDIFACPIFIVSLKIFRVVNF